MPRMPLNIEQIKRRRLAMGCTLAEVAGRAEQFLRADGKHFSRQRWSDLESGRYPDPQISTIEAVSFALDCTVQDLISPPKRPAQTRSRR